MNDMRLNRIVDFSCTLGNHNVLLEATYDGSNKIGFYSSLPEGHEPKGSHTLNTSCFEPKGRMVISHEGS